MIRSRQGFRNGLGRNDLLAYGGFVVMDGLFYSVVLIRRRRFRFRINDPVSFPVAFHFVFFRTGRVIPRFLVFAGGFRMGRFFRVPGLSRFGRRRLRVCRFGACRVFLFFLFSCGIFREERFGRNREFGFRLCIGADSGYFDGIDLFASFPFLRHRMVALRSFRGTRFLEGAFAVFRPFRLFEDFIDEGLFAHLGFDTQFFPYFTQFGKTLSAQCFCVIHRICCFYLFQ